MTEFYQWVDNNFLSFLGITVVIVTALGALIEKWREL